MARIKSRFKFPGFVVTANRDTRTHEIDVGKIEVSGTPLVLTMLRPLAHQNLSFVPASVAREDGMVLWEFKRSKGEFNGIGLLVQAGDETVIALVGHGKEGKVERVIPLLNLLSSAPAQIELKRAARLKWAAAKALQRQHNLSPAERRVLARDLRKQREAEHAARKAEREKREAARLERAMNIVRRGMIAAFTTEGQRRFGYPVVGDEWQSLSKGLKVIRVESIGEDGTIGAPVEAFVVWKERGQNPTKAHLLAVSAKQKVPEKEAAPQGPKPVRSEVFEMEDGAYEFLIFRSMEDIRAARAAGLNGGTFVAVDQPDTNGKYDILGVFEDRVDSVGKYAPIGD